MTKKKSPSKELGKKVEDIFQKELEKCQEKCIELEEDKRWYELQRDQERETKNLFIAISILVFAFFIGCSIWVSIIDTDFQNLKYCGSEDIDYVSKLTGGTLAFSRDKVGYYCCDDSVEHMLVNKTNGKEYINPAWENRCKFFPDENYFGEIEE